ncbi:helix-turn-helix domain-containing protein [Streptomyces reticuli]|uniref:helix-turn-helix domain-containing protein n=1 Tax=Streptomyces reticuli TaxID=1926 RepID=UPI00073DE0D8|nr:hypothetical protein [Streptomyces sp. SID7810]CUW29661.1 hypothetical protein TUE45_04370 [Streptomyces reticuli]
MSAVALAAAEAAPHPEPHTAADGVCPSASGGRTVRVPLRLVVGSQYSDAALAVYVKVAALALRPEGCTARVETLATYLGMSKSAVERALRLLTQPDPVDHLAEVTTTRRTKRGGTGDSAHRTTRPLADGELWVRIPVRAAEALTPRLLRLYALLAYATARRIPVTAAELAEMLHHHTGKQAGEHLGERQTRRLVDDLAATGWLTVHRREGTQGRHLYETHRHPLRTVPAAPAEPDAPEAEQLALWDGPAPVSHDGSGPDLRDGSLASKEDHSTDRHEKTQLGGGIRRRRGDRKWVARPVDNPVPDTVAGRDRVLRTDAETDGPGPATGRRTYTGPGLQLSPRVRRVLQPVRHELGGIRPFVLRRIARTIGQMLDAPGGSEDRLTDRLTRRYATTEQIRDMSRWILGAGLVRHGCGRPDCETGVIWPTGQDCETCAVNRQTAAARARREADLAAAEQRMAERRRERLLVLEDQEPAACPTAARPQPQAEPSEQEPDGTAAAGAHRVVPTSGPLPPKATYRQRDRASDDEIRAAIAEHGPAVALHIYGHLRTLPLLHGLTDPDETGTDRRTHAQ